MANTEQQYIPEIDVSGKEDKSNKVTAFSSPTDTQYPSAKLVNDQLAAKQVTITGAATTITSSNLTTNRALVSDGSGKVTVSSVTSTELGYLSGVSSAIQTQLNGKISLTALSATTPLSYNNGTGAFSISKADGSTNGYLSSTDWNTFNNKQSALGFTPENIANKKTTLADNSDTYYPTQKAVKTAVDAKLNSSALSISTGQVAFGSGSNTIGGDNGLFWDNTTKRLGIGSSKTSPVYRLDVGGTTTNDAISSDIGYNFNPVADPTSLSGVVSSGGSVDTGVHYYHITYTTALGETHSYYTAITTTAGNNTVTLTLPISSDSRVTGRKIYRTKVGAALYLEYLIATINDNTTTTYVDTVADSTLTGAVSLAYFRLNTTTNGFTTNGITFGRLDTKGLILGQNAGQSLTSGGRLTIYGNGAGANITTGLDDNLFGINAGYNLTTGSQNHLFGYNAGLNLTTGSSNSAFGHDAMVYAGANSNFNSAFGWGSGWGVVGNNYNYNSLFGAYTGHRLTTGSYHLLGGYNAGAYITSGTGTVMLGYSAGANIAGGSGNTTPTYGIYLGYGSKAKLDNQTNEIVIGYDATGNGSNSVTLGNDNILKTILKGNVGIGNTAPSYKLDVNGTGRFVGALTVGAYTLPNTDGSANQVLKTNGSGVLTWQNDSGGISLTDLSATTPLSYNNGTGVFSISQANGSTNGYLSATDWTTFNNKQATINGAATTITSSNLTNDRALISNGSGKVDVSTVTSTELGYISGVTSSIQTQLNSKQASIGFTPENVTNKKTTLTDNSDTFYPTQKAVKTAVDAKQDTLVSGTNIKTINGTSVLGSGNLTVDGLPAQAGKNGKYLKTDGTNASWEDAAGAADTLSSYTNALESDVEMPTSNTWYDATSIALPIGTFLINAQFTAQRNATFALTYFARLTNKTTHYASSQAYQTSASGNSVNIFLTAIVTLASATTIYLQGTTSSGASTVLIKAALSANESGNNATQITAIKL